MLFLVILILCFASGYFLPWWVVAIAAFLAAYFIGKKPGSSFFSGFAAVFIVWTVLALFKSIPNEHIMAKRMAEVLPLHNWVLLLLLTAFIGGLVGGMAALSGLLLKRAVVKQR
jgi:uncharacterized membrane protein YhaH (DUF805 family)